MVAQIVQFCYLLIYGLEILMMAQNLFVLYVQIGVIYVCTMNFSSLVKVFVFYLFITSYFVRINMDSNVNLSTF